MPDAASAACSSSDAPTATKLEASLAKKAAGRPPPASVLQTLGSKTLAAGGPRYMLLLLRRPPAASAPPTGAMPSATASERERHSRKWSARLRAFHSPGSPNRSSCRLASKSAPFSLRLPRPPRPLPRLAGLLPRLAGPLPPPPPWLAVYGRGGGPASAAARHTPAARAIKRNGLAIISPPF